MSYKIQINPKYQQFISILKNLKILFNMNGHTIHKARNELKSISFESVSCVVKAFRIPNVINQFAYAYIRHSKAYKSFHNAMRLQSLNVPTPTPIGFIEFYQYSFLKESFFIAKEYTYELTMANVRDDKPSDKEHILKAFARFTYDIHQKGVWHVDYSGGNILINRTDKGYDFSLVDINRMEFRSIEGYDGLENFNKMWLDKASLTIIARTYAQLANLDQTVAISKIIAYDEKLKRHVLRRRKFKALFKSK